MKLKRVVTESLSCNQVLVQSSHIKYDARVQDIFLKSYQVEKLPLNSWFTESFFMNRCWTCQMLSFHLLMWSCQSVDVKDYIN